MIGRKEKNFSYTIPDGEHKGITLWSGRYCCVAAFVFLIIGKECYILANKRGSGTPDFQGLWNCPCGFIEGDESGEEACAREVLEETGVKIDPSRFTLHSVQTDPEVCNDGHVTLRYFVYLFHNELQLVDRVGGEENEVEKIEWINIKDIDNYQWAFNHDQLIKDIDNWK